MQQAQRTSSDSSRRYDVEPSTQLRPAADCLPPVAGTEVLDPCDSMASCWPVAGRRLQVSTAAVLPAGAAPLLQLAHFADGIGARGRSPLL